MPEIQARKRKNEDKQSAEQTSINKPYPTWGMSNYLPKQLSSEDEHAIQMHTEWLKREYIKTQQNDAPVTLKMKLTFPSRRKAIVEEGISIGNLVNEYPYLKDKTGYSLFFIITYARFIFVDFKNNKT